MTPKINELRDLYNLVKDQFEGIRLRTGTVYKYPVSTQGYFNSYGVPYHRTIDNPDVFRRLWRFAQLEENPLYRIVKWYYSSLILPTQFRLINENTQGVLLRIAIGMVYKAPFSLKDKQIIYNDLIEHYKWIKSEADKQYAKYLSARDNLPF